MKPRDRATWRTNLDFGVRVQIPRHMWFELCVLGAFIALLESWFPYEANPQLDSGLRAVLVVKGGCDRRGTSCPRADHKYSTSNSAFTRKAPFPNFPASLAPQPSNTIKLCASSLLCLLYLTSYKIPCIFPSKHCLARSPSVLILLLPT